MNDYYDIEVPINPQELEEMLVEDREFKWLFPTLQDKNVQITIKLFKEDEYEWNKRILGCVFVILYSVTQRVVERFQHLLLDIYVNGALYL